MIQIFIFIFTILGAQATLPGEDCKAQQILFGRWAINRQFTLAEGCLVQVTPIEKPGLVYREYVFDQSGRMMIFNSITGPEDKATAQRDFFLLPAIQVPDIEQTERGVVVKMANGSEALFTADSPYIQSLSGGLEFHDTGAVDLSPGGNFEIVSYLGVYLDAGWAIGKRAYHDPQARSRFVLANSKVCEVDNHVLFEYYDPSLRTPHYQPILRYTTSERINALLHAACPGHNSSNTLQFLEK